MTSPSTDSKLQDQFRVSDFLVLGIYCH